MKHGNISNTSSSVIGFRFEDFLTYIKKPTKLKLLNNLFNIAKYSIEPNQRALNLLNYINSRTEYTTCIVFDESTKEHEVINFINDYNIASSTIGPIKSPEEISNLLLANEISYYVDNNTTRISEINSKYTILDAHLLSVIRGEVR